MTNCPCESGLLYEACCKPFHDGILPQNALQLMRSRYVAYVLNLPDYIIQTTHPSNPAYLRDTFAWKEAISSFSRQSHFERLEILDFKEYGNQAVVVFVVTLIQEQKRVMFTEKSLFEKVRSRWLYRSGERAEGRALFSL